MNWRPSLGAWPDDNGVRFRVWAPEKRSVDVLLEGQEPRVIALERHSDGTFGGLVPGLSAGARYCYRVDGHGPFPDPVSRFQPEGIHGQSEVVDPTRFAWTDAGGRGVGPADLL